jgi:uncharacterized membrane protein YhaH (DUF805 family)
MHYLFGFSGRINRAKMWLFLLVTLGWELAVGLVAIFGLHWSHYLQALQEFTNVRPSPFAPAPMPIPDPVGGTAWVAVAVIALMILLYFVAYFAIVVKRLHDRNKSAKWLLLYIAVPWALSTFVWLSGPMRGGWPVELFAGPMGMARGAAYVVASIIGIWIIIEFYFFRGTKGDNRFGPDPLAK